MSNREFEGKTLQEALERAVAELGPSAADLKYEILSDGRKGFLGMGGRSVRIRLLEPGDKPASPPPEEPEIDAWNRPGAHLATGGSHARRDAARARDGRGGGGGRNDLRNDAAGGRDTRAGTRAPGGRPEGRHDTDRRGPRGESTGRDSARKEAGRRDAGGGGKPPERGRPRRGESDGRNVPSGTTGADRTSRGGGTTIQWTEAQHRAAEPARPEDPGRGDVGEMDPAALHATVRSVAGRILGGMGLDLRGRLRDRDGTVILELGGPDARILLQEDGDAIVALQHILNRIVSRDEKFESRIVVDCAGFRVQRDQQVIDRAMRSAEEALRTGSPVQLEGLNAYERRLAHMALSENGAVRTYSTGEGAVRQLTIEPVRGRESSKEP